MSSQTPAIPNRTVLDDLRKSGRGSEILSSVQLKLREKKRKRKVVNRSVVASLVVIGALAWAVPAYKDMHVFETGPAERTSVSLPDGSMVDLSARTILKTDFRYRRRVVTLSQGEAFFRVAKDPSHPFFVNTGEGTVRVTGTQFDVRLSPDREEVTLLEGSVLVKTPADSATLAPGDRLGFGSGETVRQKLPPSDLKKITAWRQGQVVLTGMGLSDAMTQVGDYFGVRITVSPEVASLHLGGSYPLDSLAGFLDGLKETNHLEVLPLSDGSYVIRKK